MPTFGVHLSDTLWYFYSYPGGDLNSLESQLRLTVVLGFSIPYKCYQNLLSIFLVCTSLTHSSISTLTQEWSELFGLSALIYSGIGIWLSLHTLPEDIVPNSGVYLSDTFRYFYS